MFKLAKSNDERKLKTRLKSVRLEQKKTLQDVADALEMSNGAIANYENEIREPKLETWKKLSDYFNVPIGYLQGISEYRDVKQSTDVSRKIQNFIAWTIHNNLDVDNYLDVVDELQDEYRFYRNETDIEIFNDLYNLIKNDFLVLGYEFKDLKTQDEVSSEIGNIIDNVAKLFYLHVSQNNKAQRIAQDIDDEMKKYLNNRSNKEYIKRNSN